MPNLSEAAAKALFVQVLGEKIISESKIFDSLKIDFYKFITDTLKSKIVDILNEEISKWEAP
jgi:hypothetical protein